MTERQKDSCYFRKRYGCPNCKNKPTGKYRDELKIDGMYCRPCGLAWNIDWIERKPLYQTTIKIN
tara:strand:+ start:2078 stop:2272 length:195 start_codon:yes stop_codon:yes gene_type:complete